MRDGSWSSTLTDRFLKKPDFQLRDFGASVPDVSVSQNAPSFDFTQPVIVDAVGEVDSIGSDAGLITLVELTSRAGVSGFTGTLSVFTGSITGVGVRVMRVTSGARGFDTADAGVGMGVVFPFGSSDAIVAAVFSAWDRDGIGAGA